MSERPVSGPEPLSSKTTVRTSRRFEGHKWPLLLQELHSRRITGTVCIRLHLTQGSVGKFEVDEERES